MDQRGFTDLRLRWMEKTRHMEIRLRLDGNRSLTLFLPSTEREANEACTVPKPTARDGGTIRE